MTLYNLNYNVQVEKDAVDPEKVAVEDKNAAVARKGTIRYNLSR